MVGGEIATKRISWMSFKPKMGWCVNTCVEKKSMLNIDHNIVNILKHGFIVERKENIKKQWDELKKRREGETRNSTK